MLMLGTPLKEAAQRIRKNPASIEYGSLEKKISHLIQHVTAQVKKVGVVNAAILLQQELLSLRLDLFKSSEFIEVFKDEMGATIDDAIQDQFQNKPSFIDLERSYVLSLDICKQVSESISAKILSSTDFKVDLMPDLADINENLKSLPSRESHIAKSYIESSLTLEYGLIVSDLVFIKDLIISEHEIDSLTWLLKNSTELYAAHSIVLQMWLPSEDDESQWIRNIKILGSRLLASVADKENLTSAKNSNELESLLNGL